MIRKILVYENALADQHPALERAMQLAQQSNVELKIIDIVDSPSNGMRELQRSMRSVVEQERKERLYSICEPLQQSGIEFTIELIRGRPFVEVVREVVHDGFHLVIKAVSATEPSEVLGMMGPVDMRLVRNCPCPVWLETPGRRNRSEQILVAIDPQTEDEELNSVLLDMSVSLAKASARELHVVSAWQVPDEEFLVERMKPEKLARYAQDIEAAARQLLDALLVRAGKPVGPNEVHFRKGDATQAILDCVEIHQPDVLLMGTVGRTGVGGLLIGNTADAVLRQINCSVLAVKPGSLFHA